MIFELLISFYVLVCLFLILIVLIQKGKGSMGIGNLGGGAQLLFGSSGGQDLFQKITWCLGAIFVGGSLLLSTMKTSHYQKSRYLPQTTKPAMPISQPATPAIPTLPQ